MSQCHIDKLKWCSYFRRGNGATVSSLSNNHFPFKKYRPDFTPFAPYKNVHESGEDERQNMDFMKDCDKSNCLPAKYTPNPDWLLYKPWGYKFRKARYAQLFNQLFHLLLGSFSDMFMYQKMRTLASLLRLRGLWESQGWESCWRVCIAPLTARPWHQRWIVK